MGGGGGLGLKAIIGQSLICGGPSLSKARLVRTYFPVFFQPHVNLPPMIRSTHLMSWDVRAMGLYFSTLLGSIPFLRMGIMVAERHCSSSRKVCQLCLDISSTSSRATSGRC